MKTCTQCDIKKELIDSNFRTCRYENGKSYLKAICRDCERINSKKYNAEHKEERRLYNVNFYHNNPYRKQYKKDNKDRANKQYNNRIKNDHSFKLRKNCSRAIVRMLSRNDSSKNGQSIMQFLPYSIEELKAYIEKQFDNNMSWENYGSYWHLDHIIPQSDLPYTSMNDENFKICWSLENLRPLEAKQNILDGARRTRHKKA